MKDALQQAWDAAPELAKRWADGEASVKAELAALRKDAERYRWLRDRNSSYVYRDALLHGISARKDSPCSILSREEVPALLDAEIDKRMASAPAVG